MEIEMETITVMARILLDTLASAANDRVVEVRWRRRRTPTAAVKMATITNDHEQINLLRPHRRQRRVIHTTDFQITRQPIRHHPIQCILNRNIQQVHDHHEDLFSLARRRYMNNVRIFVVII